MCIPRLNPIKFPAYNYNTSLVRFKEAKPYLTTCWSIVHRSCRVDPSKWVPRARKTFRESRSDRRSWSHRCRIPEM